MKGLIEFCQKNIRYSNTITDSDVIVFPYKIVDDKDPYLITLTKLAKTYGKPLLAFNIDDCPEKFNLPEECTVYRTNLTTYDKLKNEEPMVPIIDDMFRYNYIRSPKLSIGFCGHDLCGRRRYLNCLSNSGLETNFIVNKITYFDSKFKLIQGSNIDYRKKFKDNLEENLFIFCYRGYGNYSYRLYEILMMGRIPILVDTDCVIPYLQDALKEGLQMVIVDERDFNKDNLILERSIRNFYIKHREQLFEIQQRNRRVYEKMYSYYGFISKIINRYSC